MDKDTSILVSILGLALIGMVFSLIGLDGIINIVSQSGNGFIRLGNFLLVHDNAAIVTKVIISAFFSFAVLFAFISIVKVILHKLPL